MIKKLTYVSIYLIALAMLLISIGCYPKLILMFLGGVSSCILVGIYIAGITFEFLN